jgi:ribonucleoside-diphosphate reductase alpha chain
MPNRAEVLKGHTFRSKTGCGNLYVTINYNAAGKLTEVFVRLGKAGGCAASQSEALGRLITMCIRGGLDTADIVKQLGGIGCHQPSGFGDTKTLSCADAVAKILAKVTIQGEKHE